MPSPKKLDTYFDLCTQVYDLSKPVPPEGAYAFYRTYVEEAQGLILEPMCGSGRFLIPLLEAGFSIHGFDASDHMLEGLHAKAKLKNLKPTVWKGFVENLSRSERYRLIFIPSGSFCLMTEPETVKEALQILYEHLAHGGVLVFEAETFKSVPPEGVWRGSKWYRSDGKMILLSQFATLDRDICSFVGKYELVDSNKIIQTEIEELKVRLYQPKELIALLQETGFKEVRTVKAFDRNSAPGAEDESIVYECKK